MSVRWILPNLGTAPAMAVQASNDLVILDVRDLVDKGGNSPRAVRDKVEEGAAHLRAGKRLVVACDYGISRSNAIAAGIISYIQNIPVDSAVRTVIETTGEAEIKLELLAAVHAALDSTHNRKSQSDQRKTVLVTGGGGFLGSALVEKLQYDNTSVVVPSRTQIDLEGSRAELDILIREQNVGCVVHLANPRVYTSNKALGTTLTILRNVLEVCSLNNVALVYPSGWEIYSGYRSTEIIADERLPPLPLGPYGETKWLCEQLVNHFRRNHNLQCVLLRMSPIYGPDGTRPKFIYNFVQKAKRGETIVTHRYRNAPAGLDLMHRDDAINALALATSTNYRGDLNIGTGNITSTEQIGRWIAEWSGSNSKVDSINIDTDTARIALDAHLAGQKIGWRPSVGVEEGLHSAIDAYFQSSEKRDS